MADCWCPPRYFAPWLITPKPTIRTTPTLTILNGNQRVDGLQLQASGHVTKDWELFAGYSLLDGKTLSSGTAAYVGKEMPNVARQRTELWTEYYLPHGIEVGGGGNWLGPRFADSARPPVFPVTWSGTRCCRTNSDGT